MGERFYLAHDNVIGVAAEQFLNNKQQIAMVARKVRKEMLSIKPEFTGEFKNHCQLSYVHQSLVNLIDMLIRGPTMIQQTSEDHEDPRQSAALSLTCSTNCI